MPLIIIQSRDARAARLSLDAMGTEFISYPGTLDRRMNIRFAESEKPFPRDGFVRLRRGADFTESGERIVDEFRYEHEFDDSDSGEMVPEKWLVYLQLDEAAFDRLALRLHWGLPELHLSFDASSQVVTFHPATDWEDLYFLAKPRPWERIAQATLVQVPFPAG